MIEYLFIILGIVISGAAQIFVTSSYNKYKKVANNKGLTGYDVARLILDEHNMSNIYVVEVGGVLSDHYDPTRKVVRLSTEVFHGGTIAAVSVAAHEVGHAIQDKENYSFMKLRALIFPVVNFASYAGYIAVMIGIIFSLTDLLWLGILCELVILTFQLVTLPVEIDASKRALVELQKNKLLETKEIEGSKKMLIAAASTYVASVVTALFQILRLVLIAGRTDDK